MVKAKAEITISRIIDIDKVTRYYLLQSSTATAPSKPTSNPPDGNWKTTEPSYTSGSTNTLYFVDLTVMTNGSFSYSAVSKSSSYEAAKEAWNKANNAQNTANNAAKTATNYLKDSEDGLVVGNMTDEMLGSNVLINPDSVNIRDGDTILARYSKKKIELGLKSNDSIIELCGGIGTISSDFINNDIPYLFICSENIYIGKSILDEGANREVNIDTNMKESYSEVSMSSRYIGNSAYIGVNASKDTGSMFKLSVDGNDKQTQVYIRHGFNATDDYSAYEGVDIWTQDVVRFTNNKSLNHIGIGIGSGGINRGIHDTDYDHWMLYCDEKDLYYQAPETSKIRPYYRAGDSIQLYYQGVGFATSDGKYVVFTLPINKPIDASNVVASSVSGFIGRSNGKYTHGSTSSTYVKPASYEAVINGNAVRVSMKFNNNTNVTNNAAIGVTWSGKITFS